MTAIRAPVEDCHWFVCASDLYSLEICEVVLAHGLIDTENASFVYILPRVFSAEHIIHLLPLKANFVLELLIDSKHVGTSLAEKAEISNGVFSE